MMIIFNLFLEWIRAQTAIHNAPKLSLSCSQPVSSTISVPFRTQQDSITFQNRIIFAPNGFVISRVYAFRESFIIHSTHFRYFISSDNSIYIYIRAYRLWHDIENSVRSLYGIDINFYRFPLFDRVKVHSQYIVYNMSQTNKSIGDLIEKPKKGIYVPVRFYDAIQFLCERRTHAKYIRMAPTTPSLKE